MQKIDNNAIDKQDYLSKSNCDCLKGIFAICVLVHHLYQSSGLFHNTVFGFGFQFLGFFSVGIFFFLSGYGLMRSYQKKGMAYVKAFPKNRLLPFYMTILFLVAVYGAYSFVLDTTLSWNDVIQSLLIGGTIINKGWYLQVQLLCYILFYLSFRFCKRETYATLLIGLFIVVYACIMARLGFFFTWYISTPLFLIGLGFACLQGKIDSLLSNNKKWTFALLISSLLLALLLVLYHFSRPLILQSLFVMLSELAFTLCVLLVLKRVRIRYWLTRQLGTISTEIYVMQGIFLSLLHSDCLYIENPYWYVLAVSAGTIIAAILIHPILNAIHSIFGGSKSA